MILWKAPFNSLPSNNDLNYPIIYFDAGYLYKLRYDMLLNVLISPAPGIAHLNSTAEHKDIHLNMD